MSRVMSKTVKQASLNLRNFIDKKNIGLELSDISEISAEGICKFWGKDDSKPEILNTVIEQISSLFEVGNEVNGWSVSYYAAPVFVDRKPTQSSIKIPAVPKGLGARFVVVVGSREIANVSLSVGSTEAQSGYLMMPGDALYIKITLVPVMEIIFNNIWGENLAPRDGFRAMTVKKTLNNRHVFVFDGHVEMSSVIEHVKNDLLGKSKKLDDKVNLVAQMAAAKEYKTERLDSLESKTESSDSLESKTE